MYFNTREYLERIRFYGDPAVDLQTLKALHKCHIFNVPFENLDIHFGKPIYLNVAYLWEKIIERNRGGICYELNALFYTLLKKLGFKAKMISGRVLGANGKYKEEFDHMAIIVDLQQSWLVDVGFGDSFLEPIRIGLESHQRDSSGFYKIVRHDQKYLRLCRSEDGINFNVLYIFTLKSRKLEDYYDMCQFHQTSPESLFTQKRLCTMPKANGRVTFKDLKIIETVNGIKTKQVIANNEQFLKLLKQHFGICI
ncbi:MAG: arylamine N-acetyltransferase [Desulfotomaculaceae bacterium]